MRFSEINSMTDERIEKLGRYFEHHRVHQRTGMTFERFLTLNKENRWDGKVYLG